MESKSENKWFALIGAVASIIAIFIFVTGKESVPELINDYNTDTNIEKYKFEKLSESELKSINPTITCEDSYVPFLPSAGCLFHSNQADIFVKKLTNEIFVFHGKEIDYDLIKFFNYDQKENKCLAILYSNNVLDLGIMPKVSMREHFKKAKFITMTRTVEKKAIEKREFMLNQK